MTNTLFTILAVLLVAAVASAESAISWTIYHSWNQKQDYVKRGTLDWGTSEESGDKKEFTIVNESELGPKEIQEMLDYGWYHVKIQGSNQKSFVFQTVPACNLRRANFKDQFEITLPRSSLDDKQDSLTSFAYTPLVSPLAPKTCDEYEATDAAKSFSSRVSVSLDTPAMVLKTVLPQSKPPPGISFAKSAKSADGTPGGGDGDGNPAPEATPSPFGFFSKYWYIILPMLIMQMMTVPAEEEEGQQQQGQQQGQGQTIAPQQQHQQQAAAASAPKARRGKTSRSKK
eukprot:CAMPEP_0116137400 /NCGR_PEP_ID=MMETSP0329-20121206/12228_1 /TAXON_ID=697910 /ORGANISM="Pseudo-nitzschia arenysensis, Strain B593" /LENGTH=285 /DNA_ID=CAMNT_0003632313 /DNA_START=82 /DNA_END=939 /DNA_ORIENTATION=-